MKKERFFELLDHAISPPEYLTDPFLRQQFKYKTPLYKRKQKNISVVNVEVPVIFEETEPIQKNADINQQKFLEKLNLFKKLRFWDRRK